MLNPNTHMLLKRVIANIPHDSRGAFKEAHLIETLREKFFPAFDKTTSTELAEMIVLEAKQDDGTPAAGVLQLSSGEYPWLPDQLLGDGNGYLIRNADATPEFTQYAAKLAIHEAQFAVMIAGGYKQPVQ